MAKRRGRTAAVPSSPVSSAPTPSAPPAHPATPAKRRPSRRLALFGALALLLLAALSLSAVSGWGAANALRVASQDVVAPEVVTVRLPDYQSDRAVRMPDVRGLDRADAEQALVDAGIPAELITVEERPAAGPVNAVIQQSPVFGSPNPSLIHLVTALSAEIPAAEGRPAADVIVELQNLGARITQVREYVPGTNPGEVVSIDPAAGSPVPAEVRITVGDSPISRDLAERDTLDGYASTSTDLVHDGVRFASAITLSVGSVPSITAWDLAGEFTVLSGQLALDPDSSDRGTASLLVRGDGRELAKLTVASKIPEEFSWTVRGVKTLTVQVVNQGTQDTPDVLLLEPALLGSAGGPLGTP